MIHTYPHPALQMLRDALANCGGNVERARDALRDMGLQEAEPNEVWPRFLCRGHLQGWM